MIRLSVENDYPGLISLWQEAFGDGEEAIGMFLDSCYNPENTVVAEENGRIVSMLFLLEGKMKIENKLYPSYYLYAAATAKSERGKGLMAELLAFAENIARNRKTDFICLKPAEKSLYDYYGKFGFKSVFSTKTVNVDYVEKNSLNVLSASECDRFARRNKFLGGCDAFIWDDASIEYAIKQHLYYGGKVFDTCKGYTLYAVDDRKLFVKEICFTNDDIDKVLFHLSEITDSDEIVIELPTDSDYGDDYEIRPNGMALAVTDSAKSLINNIRNAYLNLTLD